MDVLGKDPAEALGEVPEEEFVGFTLPEGQTAKNDGEEKKEYALTAKMIEANVRGTHSHTSIDVMTDREKLKQ